MPNQRHSFDGVGGRLGDLLAVNHSKNRPKRRYSELPQPHPSKRIMHQRSGSDFDLHYYANQENVVQMENIPKRSARSSHADESPKKKKPKSVVYYIKRGRNYFEKENYIQAIKCWKKVLQTYPANSGTIYNLAMAYEQIGDYDKADQYIRKAAKLGHHGAIFQVKQKEHEEYEQELNEQAESYLARLSSPNSQPSQSNQSLSVPNSQPHQVPKTPTYLTDLKKQHHEQSPENILSWGNEVVRIKFEDINLFDKFDS